MPAYKKALLFISIVLPGLLIAFYSYFRLNAYVRERIFEERSSIANLSAHTLSEKFQHLRNISLLLANQVLSEYNAQHSWTNCNRLISQVPKDIAYIDFVFIIDSIGSVRALAAENSTVEIREPLPDWYAENFKSRC